MRYGESTSVEVERIATAIVDCAFKMHKTLGPGLLESVYALCLIHEQLQTYLKLSQVRLGLLINFNVVLIKDGIRRVIYTPTRASEHMDDLDDVES